jgi:hypothetical protein
MRLVLGLPCPGCGLTRAFCLMSHGRFGEALAFHGLAPLMLGYLAFLWIYKVVESARGTPLRLPNEKIGLTACLALAGFWIVRLVVFFADGGLDVLAHDNIVSRVFRFFT